MTKISLKTLLFSQSGNLLKNNIRKITKIETEQKNRIAFYVLGKLRNPQTVRQTVRITALIIYSVLLKIKMERELIQRSVLIVNLNTTIQSDFTVRDVGISLHPLLWKVEIYMPLN